MPIATLAPETDLILPLPAPGETWDPHTIHTHYFGFSVPEAQIGAFLYIRYQPAFPLSQGGVAIFRGSDNVELLDMAHLNYEMTMPWPQIDGATITTENGLRIEFLEPGRVARITYDSGDGTSLDVTQTAVTPLLLRGHVMPGEEHASDPSLAPGGSEQVMHCVGTLTLDGEEFAVDCHTPRDRSWRQTRVETRGAVPVPPVCWTPMYFGDDLIFNQISFEAPDTNPAWEGIYQLPPDRPTHHFAWLHQGADTLEIVRVRRDVTAYHPVTHAAQAQTIEAEDEHGTVHRFTGEAIAMACLPAWPNTSFHDAVYRWESQDGRVAHATCQEIWFDRYQRGVKSR
jgi:hypothetical protein